MSNSARRLLIACVIDVSPSTKRAENSENKSANELINKHIKMFIKQLLANPKIKTAAEVCFVTYSTNVSVTDFTPLKKYENNVPEFKAVESGGTRTFSAINAAYDAIHNRAAKITSHSAVSCGMYTSVMFLLTDGDDSMHDDDEYRKGSR